MEILATVAALLVQTLLIFWLVREHRRRNLAEAQFRHSMAELTHMNRIASASLLSASLAHEVNQPLTGIVTRANAAMRWLNAATPNVDRAQEALKQIVEAGHRAADVVTNVRAMFTKDTPDKAAFDINELIRSVLSLVYFDLRKYGVETHVHLSQNLPSVFGNRVKFSGSS
jgi:C4-dicarboxylate-specific signal transduction histidine kinase